MEKGFFERWPEEGALGLTVPQGDDGADGEGELPAEDAIALGLATTKRKAVSQKKKRSPQRAISCTDASFDSNCIAGSTIKVKRSRKLRTASARIQLVVLQRGSLSVSSREDADYRRLRFSRSATRG
jgi:hypothetical protein